MEYAIDGAGWYPDLVRSFVMTGLERLGVPAVLLARCARSPTSRPAAAAADHDEFARHHLLLFRRLTGRRR